MVEDWSCGQPLFHSSHPPNDSCSLLKGHQPPAPKIFSLIVFLHRLGLLDQLFSISKAECWETENFERLVTLCLGFRLAQRCHN